MKSDARRALDEAIGVGAPADDIVLFAIETSAPELALIVKNVGPGVDLTNRMVLGHVRTEAAAPLLTKELLSAALEQRASGYVPVVVIETGKPWRVGTQEDLRIETAVWLA